MLWVLIRTPSPQGTSNEHHNICFHEYGKIFYGYLLTKATAETLIEIFSHKHTLWLHMEIASMSELSG